MNDKTVIIYIDNTQIVGTILKKEIGQAFTTIAMECEEYSGIRDGEFEDNENFLLTFYSVIDKLRKSIDVMPRTIYVGLPNEFCSVQTPEREIEFNKITKITKKHIDTLWDSMDLDDLSLEIVSKKALYYQIEDSEEILLDAVGVSGSGVKMWASIITISKELKMLIDNDDIRSMGFNIEFLSIAECELFMIPEEERDPGCSIIRSDFHSTSIVNIAGDGIHGMSYFNMGIEEIIKEFMENFSTDYWTAAELLKQSMPTFQLEMHQGQGYIADGQLFPSGIVNSLITKKIKQIGERIAEVNIANVIYITGGNLNEIYGARNILANACNKRIKDAVDPLTGLSYFPQCTINAMARFIANYR